MADILYIPFIVMMFATGLGLQFVAANYFISGWRFVKAAGRQTFASIVAYHFAPGKKGRFIFPVLEFYAGLKKIRVRSSHMVRLVPGSNIDLIRLKVFFPDNAPELARICKFDKYFAGAIFSVLGLGFLWLALLSVGEWQLGRDSINQGIQISQGGDSPHLPVGVPASPLAR